MPQSRRRTARYNWPIETTCGPWFCARGSPRLREVPSMCWKIGKCRAVIVLIAGAWTLGVAPARAQSDFRSQSLGGYGAASTRSMSEMGSSRSTISYAGSFGGFMPFRMTDRGAGAVSLSARGSSAMQSSRTSFSLAPMSGAMGSRVMSRGVSFEPLRSQGLMGLDGGRPMSQTMGVGDRSSVMPPNFGYPFYQPPSLLAPAGSAAGMSM
jgi:hypothetical protein